MAYNEKFRKILKDHGTSNSEVRLVQSKEWQDLVNLLRPGAYVVQRFVAIGGECVALYARDELDREVLLKLILPDEQVDSRGRDQNLKRRMLRGVTLQSLMHKRSDAGIVPEVYDCSFQGDQTYISMEWVDGKGLLDYIVSIRDSSEEEKVELFLVIAKAVEELHNYGIIHGDLKHQNIKYYDGKAAILDWGHAKRMEEQEHITAEGMAMGSITHMAPEQKGGARHRTYQSDIYSLGIILWQCFKAEVPQTFDTGRGLPETYCSLDGFPLRYQSVFTRSYNEDLGDRYQDIGDMIRDVEEILDRSRHRRTQRIQNVIEYEEVKEEEEKTQESKTLDYSKKYFKEPLTDSLFKFIHRVSEERQGT